MLCSILKHMGIMLFIRVSWVSHYTSWYHVAFWHVGTMAHHLTRQHVAHNIMWYLDTHNIMWYEEHSFMRHIGPQTYPMCT